MNISFIDCKDQSVKIIGKTDIERMDHVALVFIHWFYFVPCKFFFWGHFASAHPWLDQSTTYLKLSHRKGDYLVSTVVAMMISAS